MVDQLRATDSVRATSNRLRVLHVDHTTARGGAEYALIRMLQIEPALWNAQVLIPKTASKEIGAFEALRNNLNGSARAAGPNQPAGASQALLNPLTVINYVIRIAGQAVTLRMSPEFRGADIIHANTSRSALYASLAMYTSRKPFVMHLRDFVDEASLGTFGYVALTKLALRRADGVIANSQATLETALPYLRSGTQSRVIPSAIGLAVDEATNATRSRSLVVGMVARIDPWKGQELLVRAFAKSFSGSNVRLRLIGGAEFGHEEYLEGLEQLTRELHIESQVEFAGHVEDVPAAISNLDICVQASLRPEPLGQNVLQYLAKGRAVVAANEGGPLEWIDHNQNGLLFQARNVESLANALTRLSSNSDLRSRLGQNASSTPGLMSDFEVAQEHKDFFIGVLRERGGR